MHAVRVWLDPLGRPESRYDVSLRHESDPGARVSRPEGCIRVSMSTEFSASVHEAINV